MACVLHYSITHCKQNLSNNENEENIIRIRNSKKNHQLFFLLFISLFSFPLKITNISQR